MFIKEELFIGNVNHLVKYELKKPIILERFELVIFWSHL